MIRFFSLRNARECLLGGLAVYTLSCLGLGFHAFHVTNACAAPLWPSSGLALALLLLCGWRIFPAISLGTIAATSTFGYDPLFRIAGSFGNTLESLIGWYLMTRVCDFSPRLERVRDALILMLLGATIGPLVNSIICIWGLTVTGGLMGQPIGHWLLVFWTGNMLGILVFTPVFLHLSFRRLEAFPANSGSMVWILILIGVVCLGFFPKSSGNAGLYTVAYLTFPILVWMAISRCHQVTIYVALVTTMATVFTAVGRGPFNNADVSVTFAVLTVYVLVYCITCLIIMTAESERSLSASLAMDLGVKTARREVELRSIRASMNSHFLFNSLNSIKSLISEDPAKAQSAVVSLSDLLRTSLRFTKREWVPLREELSVIRSYLDLQKVRHDQRLDCSIEADPSSLDSLVPPMIFHQLVENALKHGVERSSETTPVRIRCVVEGGSLLLSVENKGRLDPGHEAGHGLHSIRETLSVLYAERAIFTLRQSPNHSVIAEIRLPAEA